MSRKIVLLALVVAMSLSGVVALTSAQDDDEFRELTVSDGFQEYWAITDFSRSLVDTSEILSGGPPRDGIPPYYPNGYVYPEYVPQVGGQSPRFAVRYTDIESTNAYLPDEQPVISVEIEGEARAYPLLLLNNHEIANTEINGVPIAVTFCPLCNASIVFDRRLGDRVLHLGVSGLLRNSDMIMWDHETMSWWQQFTGQGIVGELAGEQLTFLPSAVVSWGEFKAEHPDALVLENQGSYNTEQVSYQGLDNRGPIPGFFDPERIDDRLPAMERVLGFFGADGAVAYPLSRLAETGVANDVIGGEAVAVFWQPGQVSLFTNDLEVGTANLFDATLEDGTELTFSNTDDVIVDDQTGSTWNVFGRATSGELEGTQLNKRIAHPHFWFAWAAFRPDTVIWEDGIISDDVLN